MQVKVKSKYELVPVDKIYSQEDWDLYFDQTFEVTVLTEGLFTGDFITADGEMIFLQSEVTLVD